MCSLGICMTEREFECLLCGRQFTRMSADLILPENRVCDECLAALGPLDEAALRNEITRRLAARPSPPNQS